MRGTERDSDETVESAASAALASGKVPSAAAFHEGIPPFPGSATLSQILQEHTSEVWLLLDDDLNARFASDSADRLLGYSPQELLLAEPFALVHPEDRERVSGALHGRLAAPDEPRYTPLRLRHRDGSWLSFEARAFPLKDDVRVQGVLVSLRETTEKSAVLDEQRHLAAIIEGSEDAIITKDPSGRILSWNPAAEVIYGYTPDETLGQSATMLLPEGREGEEQQLLDRVSAGESIAHFASLHRRKSGEVFHASLSVSPLKNDVGEIVAISVIARDVTVQKRVQDALRASNERFQLVRQATNEVIWEWDLPLVGDASHAAQGDDEDGSEGSQMVPGWWYQVMHPDDLPKVAFSLAEAIRSGAKTWQREYRIQRHDGTYGEVLDRAYVRRGENGEPLGLIGSMADVSEQRRVERALVDAKEEAEAANRTKSEFLSGMSHELRTPLNSVIGFANVLRKNRAGNLTAQDLTYLERILANGKHLLGLINSVLDLAKIEAGKMDVRLESASLPELIHEVIELVQGNVRPGVELRTDLPALLRPVDTDAGKLKQILINLAGNALKFTEKGRVTVRLCTDSETGETTAIEVEDTGQGIAEDRLEAIFEAFEQADNSPARRYEGTGLGLAISSSLARLLGYRIEVESELGKGSLFRVNLHTWKDGPVTPVRASSSAQAARSRALVVEADLQIQSTLTRHLEQMGCEVLAAASEAEGLKLAEHLRPNVLFLNPLFLMPGSGEEGGGELYEALRARSIPVILTGAGNQVPPERLRDVQGWLPSPHDISDVALLLERVLQAHPARLWVVGEDEPWVQSVEAALGDDAGEVRLVRSSWDVLRMMRQSSPEVLLLCAGADARDALGLVRYLRDDLGDAAPAVIVLAEASVPRDALDELALAAHAVLPRDSQTREQLRWAVRTAARAAERTSDATPR